MSNNDALREALEIVDAQANDEGLWFHAATAPEGYLQAALRELHVKVEALAASKPEPQAQAREPEVVVEVDKNFVGDELQYVTLDDLPHGTQLITLQSHREAMTAVLRHKEDWKSSCVSLQKQRNALQEDLAKKDEALKACVSDLQAIKATLERENEKHNGAISDTIWHTKYETLFDFVYAAIIKAQEALK